VPHISEQSFQDRATWITNIGTRGGSFTNDTDRLQNELRADVAEEKGQRLYNHLRLCGNIPEQYDHDSSEEKQYSKYTDALLSIAFERMAINSLVLTERGDAADVEGFTKDYSFVADAKAFRLSRTAKNQKDFKVQQMDNWKHGKPFAMVVCPIYQVPSRSSQIYLQAIVRNVCVFTYSHLTVLVRIAEVVGEDVSQKLLHDIFLMISSFNPSKDSHGYWIPINQTMLKSCDEAKKFWKEEKEAVSETVVLGKKESLEYLAAMRERMVRMSHKEAVAALIIQSKIDAKIRQINSVSDNGLFGAV